MSENVEKEQEPVLEETSSSEEDVLKDKYIRLQADFDNFRKRVAKERVELLKYAAEEIVTDLLCVLDNFERAMESAKTETDMNNFLEGIKMIQKQMQDVLLQKGVSKMETSGKPFDANLHEALLHEESETVAPDHVLEELQPGYMLNDKVIRHAKVKVSKAKEEN